MSYPTVKPLTVPKSKLPKALYGRGYAPVKLRT